MRNSGESFFGNEAGKKFLTEVLSMPRRQHCLRALKAARLLRPRWKNYLKKNPTEKSHPDQMRFLVFNGSCGSKGQPRDEKALGCVILSIPLFQYGELLSSKWNATPLGKAKPRATSAHFRTPMGTGHPAFSDRWKTLFLFGVIKIIFGRVGLLEFVFWVR